MGTATKLLRPSADDSMSIPLDKTFGLELFTLIKAKSSQVSSSERFVEYFKGIKIQTDSITTAQVVGFQKTMTIRIHYHEDDGNIIQKHIDLGSASSPYQFNHIDRNFIGSALAPLQAVKEVNATHLQNRFFVQNLFRIRTRISFPAIRELLKVSDFEPKTVLDKNGPQLLFDCTTVRLYVCYWDDKYSLRYSVDISHYLVFVIFISLQYFVFSNR